MDTDDELFEAANEVLLCGNTLRRCEAMLLKAQQMVVDARVRWENAVKVMAHLEAQRKEETRADL